MRRLSLAGTKTTNLHLDHLEGLGFFTPLWERHSDLHIWGPASPLKSLEDRIATYLSPPLFPVHLSDVPSHPTFHDVPWKVGTLTLCPPYDSADPIF